MAASGKAIFLCAARKWTALGMVSPELAQYLFTIDSPGGNFTHRAAREPPRNLRNLK